MIFHVLRPVAHKVAYKLFWTSKGNSFAFHIAKHTPKFLVKFFTR